MSEERGDAREAAKGPAEGNPDGPRTGAGDELLDGVYEFDLSGRLLYCNPSAKALFGYGPDEDVSGLRLQETIVDEDQAVSARDIERILAGETVRGQRTFVRRDGECFWGEIHSGPILRDGRVVGVRGVLRDITAHMLADERVRESELRFRTLFDLSPLPIAVTELETGRLLDVNRSFCELGGFARDEVLGRTTLEIGILPPERREQFAERMRAEGAVNGMPMLFTDRSGAQFDTLMFARRITLSGQQVLLTVVMDITERRNLEARLQQAQKLEAVGTLAGGVAHDFNNILTVVGGLSSLGLRQLDPGHPVSELLIRIEEQVQSASALTRQLLAYARTGRYEMVATDLCDILRRSAEIFARTRKDLSLLLECGPGACWAAVDRSQFEHALLNLYVNAAQAMPGGGRLRVAAGYRDLDRDDAARLELSAGRHAVVVVEDSGMGMDEATRRRIFEPFFTTKEMGRGTGLGLASVYGIVKGHGGAIDVWSEPGRGTRFDIFLPAAKAGAPAAADGPGSPQRGQGLVLLVDDEEAVASVTESMLRTLGYVVVSARGGAEAIELFRGRPREVDLVLLDMVMPGMGGAEVFDELRRIRPDAAVLLFTGYGVERATSALVAGGCRGVLRKPFTIHELARSVATALRGERTC